MANILEEAQRLYNGGKWTEAIQLIDKNFLSLKGRENIAEALRVKGWSYYYLAIKGPEAEKQENLVKAEDSFRVAWERTGVEQRLISIANGLPLVLWLRDDKEAAWGVSDYATEEFPGEPSVWNTRAILCRWAKDLDESIRVCRKVYETALAKDNYRTAGHGQQNLGDTYVLMVHSTRKPWKRIALAYKAFFAYWKARKCYVRFEKKTSEKATVHYKAATKKMLSVVRELFR
jgi:tetratricopeptide (TPR) repeat protein